MEERGKEESKHEGTYIDVIDVSRDTQEIGTKECKEKSNEKTNIDR